MGITGPPSRRRVRTSCGAMYTASGTVMVFGVWVLVGGGTSTWVGSSVVVALSKYIMLVRRAVWSGMSHLVTKAM